MTATVAPVLAELPEREREILYLRFYRELNQKQVAALWLLFFENELTYAGVAEILGRSVGSLGPTRSRCPAKLRQLLEQPLTEER